MACGRVDRRPSHVDRHDIDDLCLLLADPADPLDRVAVVGPGPVLDIAAGLVLAGRAAASALGDVALAGADPAAAFVLAGAGLALAAAADLAAAFALAGVDLAPAAADCRLVGLGFDRASLG